MTEMLKTYGAEEVEETGAEAPYTSPNIERFKPTTGDLWGLLFLHSYLKSAKDEESTK